MRIQHDINPIEPGRNKVSLAASARREACGAVGARPVKKDSKRELAAEEEWERMVDAIDGERMRKGKEREEAAAKLKKKPGPPKGWKELKRQREASDAEQAKEASPAPPHPPQQPSPSISRNNNGDSDSDDSFTGPFMPSKPLSDSREPSPSLAAGPSGKTRNDQDGDPSSANTRPRHLTRYLIAKAKHRQAMMDRDLLEQEFDGLKKVLDGVWDKKEKALDAVLIRELG